jgi:hypothetical protein
MNTIHAAGELDPVLTPLQSGGDTTPDPGGDAPPDTDPGPTKG